MCLTGDKTFWRLFCLPSFSFFFSYTRLGIFFWLEEAWTKWKEGNFLLFWPENKLQELFDEFRSLTTQNDRILFFEHESVYTLGRGADENHLTFLNQDDRHLLSRRHKSAGESGDSEQRQNSRLYVDKFKRTQDGNYESIEEEVNSLGM